MNIEQQLRESLRHEDPGEQFTESVLASTHGPGRHPGHASAGVASLTPLHARRSRRYLLLGAAIAAAAAVLSLLREQDSNRVPAPVASISLLPAAPGDAQATEPAAHAAREAAGAPAPESGPASLAPSQADGTRVMVMPLTQRASIDAAQEPARAFFDTLVQHLRGYPDLTVIDGSQAQSSAAPGAEFVITLTTLDGPFPTWKRQQGGGVPSVSDPDTLPPDAPWYLEAKIAPVGLDEYAAALVVMDEISSELRCTLNARTRGGPTPVNRGFGRAAVALRNPCGATEVAMMMAELTRVPPPGAAQMPGRRELVSKLRNLTLDAFERDRAAAELINQLRDARSAPLDAATVDVMVEYASGLLPRHRAAWWRSAGEIADPALAQPLMAAAREDADERVRLTAIAALKARHADRPAIRSTLARLSREDSSEVVRRAAARDLANDAAWNAFVRETLRDDGRSREDRVLPLLHTSQSLGLAGRQEEMRQVLDAEKVLLIIDLIRSARSQGDSLDFWGPLFGIVSARADHPALTQLQLEILDDGADPDSMRMASDAVRGLLRQRDAPPVRAVLEKLLRGNDPGLRDQVERGLASPAESVSSSPRR